jgi:hypothetical protein
LFFSTGIENAFSDGNKKMLFVGFLGMKIGCEKMSFIIN